MFCTLDAFQYGIGGTRNVVVYACPNTNWLVCENGVTVIRIGATNMVIQTSPRLSTMVVEICNAKVTYSAKQLTADCVDEKSVHHGFNVDNDYNIRFRTV